MNFRRLSIALAAAAIASSTVLVSVSAQAHAAVSWKNCDAVHKTYPHGVGRKNAKDHTSGTPVKNFRHSNKLFKAAMDHNKGLDGDGDKIACEAA